MLTWAIVELCLKDLVVPYLFLVMAMLLDVVIMFFISCAFCGWPKL
jgi:hypothetical protein